MPYVGKKPADIIATAVDTTTGKFSGEIDAASLDISGNIDVDGTTNLDVVDIDGAVDMATTLAVTGALSAKGGAVFNEDSADVDFRVEGNNDTHALFVQGGSDHVGINNTSPNSQLTGADNLVVGNTGVATSGMTFVGSGGSGSQGLIHFSDATSGNARYDGFIGYEHTDRIMKFGTAQAEQVRIHSNGVLSASDGIALGVGTANTASNVLSDYEEGTWSISYTGVTNTPSYHIIANQYTKIGRLVTLNFNVQFNTAPTFSSSTAELQVIGLPFAVQSTGGYINSTGALRGQGFNFNGSTYNTESVSGQVVVATQTTNNSLVFKVFDSGTSSGTVRNASASAGGIIECIITYLTTA